MKNLSLLILASAFVSLATPASAQFRKPEDAIKYRQSVMTVQGRAFYGSIGGMASGRTPFDPKVAADSAELIALLARLPWVAFGPGTDKGAPTDAKPTIWTDSVKFKELADKMQAETTKLAAAAKTGNLENLKSAYAATRETCKACHDAFTSQ